MRTYLRLFSALAAILPIFVLGNVYVHGYVKYPNGTPAVGIYVTITSDSAVAQSNCQQTHYKRTNVNGYYVDTLVCTGTISSVKTWLYNPCTSAQIIHLQAPNNQVVESNFTVCDSSVNICYSNFTFYTDSTNVTRFFSSSSNGATQLDTVISRTWIFGDGTGLSGNVVNPVHVYTTSGTFNACLTIKTASGCTKTSCNTVVSVGNTSCFATFSWVRSTAIANRILFDSDSSYAVGDSIISRKWKFGDGDSLAGNIIFPEHTYPGPGTYNCCLTIKTRLGCEKTFCRIIPLVISTSCHAAFSSAAQAPTASGYPVYFYSGMSTAAAGDSIIQRSWTFGDGTSSTGAINPTRIYQQPGTYTVCLKIVSASGCRDSICQTIATVPAHCLATFTVDSITTPAGGNPALKYFKFNSSLSHGLTTNDSIVSRKWRFGDGDSLNGNVIIPVHGYGNPGIYNICLYITTADGCRDTICKTITITAIVCHASFVSTVYPADSTGYKVKFNASSSTASSGSTIVQYTWLFGDGTSGTGVDPTHIYAQMGTYNVCLRILSSAGCRDSLCKTVTIQGNCEATFYYDSVGLGYGPNVSLHYVRMSSINSHASSGADTIISRKWKFGDGDSLITTSAIVSHIFSSFGSFNICLTIKTSRGCENTYCSSIYIPNPVTFCRANFIYNPSQITATTTTIKFSSRVSITAPGDSIVNCHWIYGDGASGGDSLHQYHQPGTYSACLQITCASGCRDTICKPVTITATHLCTANFTSESISTPTGGSASLKYKRFISTSTAATGDSVVTCRWTFGDGSWLQTNGYTRPTHGYAQVGTYTVCLYITSLSGCTDSTCQQVIVRDSTTNTTCLPRFTTLANALLVTFNGSTSTVAAGDSIVSRTWSFGDGSASTSSAVVLTHQYPRPGVYSACLTIRTRLGCVATICKQLAVVDVTGNCIPFFAKEQVAAPTKTMRFNSSAAYSQVAGDSIVARKWEFGDGQILTGNVINPLHTYLHGGTYTVCLTIYTAHCDKKWCQTIQVLPIDSTNATDSVNIVSLYPVPVVSPLNVVLHSSHANVNAQLAIYDVYGVLKWSQNTVLPLGNSTYSIPTYQLAAGPYIFKLTTVYGVRSRSFYKIN